MDVVYPLADRSKHGDDFELRYSLRSLAEQSWVDRVFLVGHCPVWARNVEHIECGDPYQNKDANLIAKVLLACERSERFVVNSDDQYILTPTDDFGPWADLLYAPSRSRWSGRVEATRQWCCNHGYSDAVFQSHVPYVVDAERYRAVMAEAPWSEGRYGLTTHVYLNMTAQPRGECSAVRIKGPERDPARFIEGRTFLNHNDAGLNDALRAFLIARFPKPSKWETPPPETGRTR